MAPLVGLCSRNASQRSQSLIGLQMSHRFTKCFIFLFKIPKDNKDFFHGCRHDYEHHEIWHQQEVGNLRLLENFSFEKRGTTPKWLKDIKIDVDLM